MSVTNVGDEARVVWMMFRILSKEAVLQIMLRLFPLLGTISRDGPLQLVIFFLIVLDLFKEKGDSEFVIAGLWGGGLPRLESGFDGVWV